MATAIAFGIDTTEGLRRLYGLAYRALVSGRFRFLFWRYNNFELVVATVKTVATLLVEQEMRDYAEQVLAPPMQKLVAATRESFVQEILDLDVPQVAFGRVILLGDAAFIVRPHTAAGTSKAAANAKAWEPGQLVDAEQLSQHGQFLGRRSQFTHGLGRFLPQHGH
ncbi:hypothetical protein SPB21_08015 [Leptothoe sp. ISB3NOV94-8A]